MGEYLNGIKWNGQGFFKPNKFWIGNYNRIGLNFLEVEFKNGNGFGKEYFSNNDIYQFNRFDRRRYCELIFEGEYLNGKREEKGKEYDSFGDLIFEGEYKNGKINGKGKEDHYGVLIFECEYFNGLKWTGNWYESGKLDLFYEIKDDNGNGKEYDFFGNLIRGEFKNGKLNEKGKEYDNNGRLKFEGQFKNGKRHGKGKEFQWNGKIIFEGEYKNGERVKK